MDPPEFTKVKYKTWAFGFIFILAFIPLMFYAPVATNYVYSYVLQPNPGILVSERWHYGFVVTGSIILLIAAPLSLLATVSLPYMMKGLRVVHVIIVIILLVWFISAFIVGCVDWGNANLGTSSNYFNQANDPRWCCVYYTLPASPCPQQACNPTYTASQLITNPTFLYQLWYIFILCFGLILDMIFFFAYVRKGLEAYEDANREEEEEAEKPDNEKILVNQNVTFGFKNVQRVYRPKSSYV
jgi:hypothetical protein